MPKTPPKANEPQAMAMASQGANELQLLESEIQKASDSLMADIIQEGAGLNVPKLRALVKKHYGKMHWSLNEDEVDKVVITTLKEEAEGLEEAGIEFTMEGAELVAEAVDMRRAEKVAKAIHEAHQKHHKINKPQAKAHKKAPKATKSKGKSSVKATKIKAKAKAGGAKAHKKASAAATTAAKHK